MCCVNIIIHDFDGMCWYCEQRLESQCRLARRHWHLTRLSEASIQLLLVKLTLLMDWWTSCLTRKCSTVNRSPPVRYLQIRHAITAWFSSSVFLEFDCLNLGINSWISANTLLRSFLPYDTMLAQYVLLSCVRLSDVCLSHNVIVLKLVNVGSCKL